jgi:phosphoesterase RecJ-like protein
MSIPEGEWVAAVSAVRAAAAAATPREPIALACHVNPDGDALGSLVAVGLALRALGVPVVGSHGTEPFRVQSALDDLPGLDLLVPPAQFPPAPRLLITFDTGNVERLGSLAPAVPAARDVLVVDHHASNTKYGTLHLLDVSAASTTAVVDELIRRLGVPVDHDIATALYVGLVTDTGSFKYAATTPDVHRFAARLLEAGVEHEALARRLFDTHRFGYLNLLGIVLTRAVLEPEADLVWAAVSQADLTAYGVQLEEVEGVIDVLRTAEEAEVAVVLKEDGDGTIKVSTRSKGSVDVGAACVALGGGGHRFAAGFTSDDGIEGTLAKLRGAIAAAPRL